MSRLGTFDVIGPIMIGPSSSHTAGAARLGFACSRLIKGQIASVSFRLHGSFAKTYKGHGTDRALLAGVMGFREYSEELRLSFEIAAERGIRYEYLEEDLGDAHPNTVRILVEETSGRKIELVGSSIGGGNIRITGINGVQLQISGDNPAIVARHDGGKGIITGIALFMNEYGYDIKYMSFHKTSEDREDGIIVIEVDKTIEDNMAGDFEREIPGIIETYIIQ